MLNVLVLVGRVSKTPELRKADDGTAYGSFDIAVDNLHGKKNEKSTSFFQVKVFGKMTENVAKCVKVGSKVGIQGSIEQRSWKREDGTTKVTLELQKNPSTYNFILGCGDEIKVIEPQWLADKIKEMAHSIYNKYIK